MAQAKARHYDCVIVGGGPAGLTAAIYLARFHLSAAVLDNGRSRALMIPVSHNHAGFPEGIAGAELIRRMGEQARLYGAACFDATVTGVKSASGGFLVSSDGGGFVARTVLLATGVWNHRPAMPDGLHDQALRSGLLRYCPVCDGYEVTDRRIAVIGSGEKALKEAEFLRSYTADVTLIAHGGKHDLDAPQRARAGEWGIALVDGPCSNFAIERKHIELDVPAGRLRFDSAYAALGSDVHSELAAAAGAKTSAEGCILADRHQATSVEGLYAAGDVVLGLDQIGNAMGQAGVAATAIRNALCLREPLRRNEARAALKL